MGFAREPNEYTQTIAAYSADESEAMPRMRRAFLLDGRNSSSVCQASGEYGEGTTRRQITISGLAAPTG